MIIDYLDWILSFLTVVSIYLTQQPNRKLHKYPSLIGVCMQPLWLWFSIHHELYAFVLLAIVYSWVWGYGFYIHWIKKDNAHKCNACGRPYDQQEQNIN